MGMGKEDYFLAIAKLLLGRVLGSVCHVTTHDLAS